MASGTGARPLPEPAEERELLGLGSLQSTTFEIPASTTKTLAFVTEIKDGLLVLSAGTAAKRGLYIFGSSSTGNLSVTTVLAATQSGISVTASGNNIAIANGTSALFVCVLQFKGNLPTMS